ncbi:MAG: PD40 domain-containing protein, partial [Acidobacteria bacterium]|nr:PD40 domain-containing protein [Acidobacteriota bacterium]
FSFGVVLYEMATGRSPFLRGSAASTAAAILRDTPQPVRVLVGELPAELEGVISKALEKEPEFRHQTMDELVTDLKRLRRDLESGRLVAPAEVVPVAATSRWRQTSLWAGGAVLLVTILVLAALLWRGREGAAPPTPSRVIQLTTLPGLEDSPTWSPDGRSLAYVSDAAGNLDIYVQQIGGGPAIKVTDSDADDAEAAWSPDGSRIAFVSARAYPEKRLSTLLGMGTWQAFFAGRNGDVWLMPALGGTGRRIAQDAYNPAWSPDGKKIAYQALREGRWGLWVQEVDTGSDPRVLNLDGLDVSVATQPAWSQDGKWIAFTAGGSQRLSIYLAPSGGGEPRELTPEHSVALMPSWSPDGQWLFFSSDRGGKMNLWKARFENGRLATPRQVTAGSGADLRARLDPEGKRLAYSSVRNPSDLWEYNLKTAQAIRLTTETTLEDSARPSPDGTWLAFSSDRLGGNHLWLLNRKNGSLTQVSTSPGPGIVVGSHWSWSGNYLFYQDGGALWRYELGTGSSEKVYEGELASERFCVSADDKYLVVAQQGIRRVELGSAKTATLAQPAEGTAADPACSPDDQWVAFHVERGNTRKIWVVPLAGGPAQQLTFGDSEDSHPTWSADSRLIYFVRNHQDIYVVARAGGERQPVTNYRSFSILLDYPVVTADGQRLVFTRTDKAGDIYLLESAAE